EGHGALWSTGTSGAGHTLAMQGDGNLVLYDAASKPVWASNTSGHVGATLAVQNDGNLVVYQAGTPLWASNTSGH
ncbi:MAG TPA: lectin, partial [Polyangiaceae bacterium]